jgi:Tat protein translocase TatB subunit
MFGNIGFPELLVIMTIALLVFGPRKLPEIGRSIGKAMREFRRTSDEIKEKIEEEIQAEEFKDIKEEIDKDIKDIQEGNQTDIADEIYKDADKDDKGEKVT